MVDTTTAVNNGGSTQSVFTVHLSEELDEDITVNYETVDNTAVAGTDYEAASGSVTIAAGATSATFSITIYGRDEDDTIEDRTFYIKLTPVADVILASDALTEVTITISNEDDETILSVQVAAGPRGYQGLSAYEVAVNNGYEGTTAEWLLSLVGADGADGNTILSTDGAPDDSTGNDGDFAIDVDNQMLYGPKADSAWPDGVSFAGADGTDGNTILSTDGAPSDDDGVNGDYALDVTNLTIYGPKADDAWPDGVSFQGTAGTDGNTILSLDDTAPTADDGVNGDYAIDYTNWVIYGPKADDEWPDGQDLIAESSGSGSSVFVDDLIAILDENTSYSSSTLADAVEVTIPNTGIYLVEAYLPVQANEQSSDSTGYAEVVAQFSGNSTWTYLTGWLESLDAAGTALVTAAFNGRYASVTSEPQLEQYYFAKIQAIGLCNYADTFSLQCGAIGSSYSIQLLQGAFLRVRELYDTSSS